jgi:hypothetical protein
MEDMIDILQIYTHSTQGQWMNTICKKIHQIKYAMHDLTNNEAAKQGHASLPPPANPSLPLPLPLPPPQACKKCYIELIYINKRHKAMRQHDSSIFPSVLCIRS